MQPCRAFPRWCYCQPSSPWHWQASGTAVGRIPLLPILIDAPLSNTHSGNNVAVIWPRGAWVIIAPLTFPDPEYPAWLAKERLLARCDLGELLDPPAAVD